MIEQAPPDGDEASEPRDPHEVRGRGFLDSGLYDDAITELTSALESAPSDLPVIRDLAKAHLLRWRRALETGAASSAHPDAAASDQERAEGLLRLALDQAPDDRQSHALIAQLRRVQEQHARRRSRRGGRFGAFGFGLALALLAAGLAGALFVFRSAPSPPPDRPEVRQPSVVTPEVGDPVVFKAPDGADLVFELVAGPAHVGLSLEPTQVELKLYSTAWFGVEGLIHNGTDDVITELEARAELFAEDGTVLLTEHQTLLDEHEAPLRPGDVLPVGGTERATPEARRLRLTITASKRGPAPASFEEDQVVPLRWGMEAPDGVELEVTRRRQRQNKHIGASWFVRHDLLVRNTGSVPVSSLKFESRFKDASGAQITTDDSWIVGPDDPPLQPGAAYGGTVVEIVDREPAEVELWVARLQ